jgi:hypothetical protein
MSKFKIIDGKIEDNNSILELIREIELLRDSFDSIENIVEIAKMPGNYDANLYLWGMANGMILIQSILKKTSPVYLEKPKRFRRK